MPPRAGTKPGPPSDATAKQFRIVRAAVLAALKADDRTHGPKPLRHVALVDRPHRDRGDRSGAEPCRRRHVTRLRLCADRARIPSRALFRNHRRGRRRWVRSHLIVTPETILKPETSFWRIAEIILKPRPVIQARPTMGLDSILIRRGFCDRDHMDETEDDVTNLLTSFAFSPTLMESHFMRDEFHDEHFAEIWRSAQQCRTEAIYFWFTRFHARHVHAGRIRAGQIYARRTRLALPGPGLQHLQRRIAVIMYRLLKMPHPVSRSTKSGQ